MLPLLIFPVAFIASSVADALTPTVALDYGVFHGKADGNLSTFLGVPFSQPAVRFSLPQTLTLLHGVQNATAFGAACPQQALIVPAPIPPQIVEMPVSEDCLKLNVFAPRSAGPHSNLPVLVWIYGGMWLRVVERSITTGEPIIIVTPNYRLSAYGFLGGKEVGDAGISNLGLRDQIFALEWVQEHIAAFGGDPARVVMWVYPPERLLLLSNKRFEQTALFRGAFMVSGSPITSGSLADGQADYNALRQTIARDRRTPWNVSGALQTIWRPRVDGDVIVEDPLISVSKSLYAKVPIMTGDADDEGALFSLTTRNITTNDEFLGYIHSNFLPKATTTQIAEIGWLYPDDPTQGSPFDTGFANQLTPQFKRLAAFQTDYEFTAARRFFLEHASRTQSAWSWLSKRGKSTPILGAAHGSDIPIWFPPANSTDFVLTDALVNFINNLDPNTSSSGRNSSALSWPKWNSPSSDGSTSLLTLSDPSVVSVTPEVFRIDAIKFLYGLLLNEAESSK
ncbi:Alpha/Beta hydrolase protein [Mycena capillaripes]|nr:Alpha/Beta hydrolase protein [Mycena capillaripes]